MMTTTPEPASDPRPSRFDASMRFIGDLDHQFYEDERNRFVWYEASAIGFQLLLLLSLVSAALAMLILGPDAAAVLPFVIVPMFLAATVVTIWARRQNAMYVPTSGDLTRRRGVMVGVLVLVLAAGAVRMAATNEGSGSVDRSLEISTIVGAFIGVVAAGIMLGVLAAKARSSSDDDDDEDDED